MAVRLSVVMVHSTPATPTAERVAQGVVGELIGLSGIDLILVAPLDSLSETSTDRLTLSSLGGDIAVLDWRLAEVTHESLKVIGVDGARTRHSADPDVVTDSLDPATQPRKLYLFNLTEFTTAEAVISALTNLNESRAVRTFALAPIVKRPESDRAAQSGGPVLVSEKVSGMVSSTTPAGNARAKVVTKDGKLPQQAQAKSPTPNEAVSSTSRASEISSVSGYDDQDLDALIDRLDQLDP